MLGPYLFVYTCAGALGIPVLIAESCINLVRLLAQYRHDLVPFLLVVLVKLVHASLLFVLGPLATVVMFIIAWPVAMCNKAAVPIATLRGYLSTTIAALWVMLPSSNGGAPQTDQAQTIPEMQPPALMPAPPSDQPSDQSRSSSPSKRN